MAKIIGDELLQGIIKYMGMRPYQEVYQVMPSLTSLPEFIPVEPPKPEEK